MTGRDHERRVLLCDEATHELGLCITVGLDIVCHGSSSDICEASVDVSERALGDGVLTGGPLTESMRKLLALNTLNPFMSITCQAKRAWVVSTVSP